MFSTVRVHVTVSEASATPFPFPSAHSPTAAPDTPGVRAITSTSPPATAMRFVDCPAASTVHVVSATKKPRSMSAWVTVWRAVPQSYPAPTGRSRYRQFPAPGGRKGEKSPDAGTTETVTGLRLSTRKP